MTAEELPPKPREKSARKAFTPERAREEFLARLLKAGKKGALSLFPPKAPNSKRPVYEHVLAEMERGRELYADRRTSTTKYYIWALRPQLPSRDSVAAQLEEFILSRHPMLVGIAELKKAVGKNREALQYLFSAFELLAARGKLVILRHRKGRTYEELYGHADALRQMLGPDPVALEAVAMPTGALPISDLDPDRVRAAYAAIVARTNFRTVPIATLHQESGARLSALKAWIREQHAAGSAVLTQGNWASADDANRAAAIEMKGERYLLVKLLTNT